MFGIFVPSANIHFEALNHCALPVLHALREGTSVRRAVSPDLLSFSLHLASHEVTCVSLVQFGEHVLTLTFENSANESTFVVAAILPLETSIAFFLVFDEVTREFASI